MKIKNYVVSSADWSYIIDESDYESAANSAVIMAISQLGSKLKMSTVIMVNSIKGHKLNDYARAKFIPSHKVFENLGLKSLSNAFKQLCENI